MRLDMYDNANFIRGTSRFIELLWLTCDGILLSSWLPGSIWRVKLLQLFGARIGGGVIIKPGVHVKFPWRLSVGNHCWIGESVWIDNLAEVVFGDHVCISQGVYFCTGSHDWSKISFDLITKPIAVNSHVWIGAMSRIAPGVSIGEGAVIGFGSITTRSVDPWSINSGSNSVAIKSRRMEI